MAVDRGCAKGNSIFVIHPNYDNTGGRIDLATNQCFLSRLGRSLTLKESKNGLYLIDMSELCLEQSEVHHVETLTVEAQASIVSNFRPPPGLDLCVSSCHAESKGSHGHGSHDGRSSHGITETSLGGPHVVGRDSQSRARSSSRDRQQCGPTIDRSPHPAEPHRRDCQDFERSRKPEAPTSASNESRTVKEPWRSESNTNDTESHGTRGMGTGVFTCERGASDVANKGNVDPSSARSGSWSPINFTDSDKNTECGSINQRSCSAERAASESAKLPDCTDLPSPGTLGKQTCFAGKEASWVPICSSVRGRSRVSNMDLGTNKKCFSTNARFHHVHQRPSGIGATSIAKSDMTSSEVLVSKVQPLVKSTEKLKWLNVCRHEQPVPHPIDLLEVYASDTSKLTSEVIRQGGRAKRFTKEDGDLSTFEGQCKLLKMIFRYRPKHIWMAPECAPWCQWNRFNQGRSIAAWNRVFRSQEQSRTHLRLCSLILQVQLNLGGHFHLENPLKSALWDQPEIQPICNQTGPVPFRPSSSGDSRVDSKTHSSTILLECSDSEVGPKDLQ